MRELKLKAKAKINLGLDVVRKREDGYHEVRMIMQMINLYDKITLRKKTEPGITVTANLSYLPVNEDNLVYRAAKLLMDEFQVDGGLEIELQKYIPVAAGMAGGSTDAAAVMVGVNRIFQLGLNKKQLMERGVKIGADVPFCIMRGTALADIIQHIKVHTQCQQSQQQQLRYPLRKTQLLIQQIKYYQNQHNHTTININPRLVIIDINRFHQCKMSSHLGNSICVKLNLIRKTAVS